MNIQRIMNYGLTALLGLLFIFALVPQVEGAEAGANITNTTTSAFSGIAAWMVPVGLLAAVIISGVKLIAGRRRGG